MRGDGTKLAITTNNPPPARLLDLTRLVSRAGLRPTGVDRVERAYLDALIADPVPCYGLIRSALGYVLLDQAGLVALVDRFDGTVPWGAADRLSRISRKLTDHQRRAQSDLRRIALDRARPRGLQRMLARHLPDRSAYFNTGHSNLTDRVLNAVKYGLAGKIVVLVHDTIPLDFPEFQRDGTVSRFAGFLKRVGDWADLIICNSAQTRSDVIRHLAPERGLNTIVSHLGIEEVQPRASELPQGLDLSRPYFVTVGTIEPRKNHALLLDVWAQITRDLPEAEQPLLYICGRRGWKNEEIFARLDARPQAVIELNGLSDEAIAALVARARAALYPSLAEGYGLGAVEARKLGTPVICSDLPVTRELLDDETVYLNAQDRYQWIKAIMETMSDTRGAGKKPQAYEPPTWDAHFKAVLNDC